ncbi:MAG: PAS domain-containing protein, partial [Usitatibacter sp.]
MGMTLHSAPRDAPPPAFLSGGGDMGARIRAHDWPGSPLGDPDEWPQALKTLVALMLASKQPMFMAWGPEQTWLYNDAFVPILGAKHPAALGRHALVEVWSEAREVLAALFARVFAGEPVHMDDFALMLDRHGRLEEAHFAFSYTPVRDESGSVCGLFGACIETTDRILASRREMAALERQRRMFEQAPSFVCMLGGADHVFEFVNIAHQQLFGSASWIGKPVREAFSDLVGQGYYERLDEVYRTGKRYVAEADRIKLRRVPSGPAEERLLSFIYEPVLDNAGQVTGIFCEGFDVTEAHRAQQKLREADRRKDEFLA